MSYSIELTEDARKDAAEAVKWYNEQRKGLGDIFVRYLNESLEKISISPQAYKKIYKQVRQASLSKFP